LSNAVPDPAPIVKSLEWEFSLRVASRAMRVDAVTLFGEMSPGGDFRILRRFPLGRSQRQRRLSSRVAAAAFIDWRRRGCVRLHQRLLELLTARLRLNAAGGRERALYEWGLAV
jgi:hypothetical protein